MGGDFEGQTRGGAFPAIGRDQTSALWVFAWHGQMNQDSTTPFLMLCSSSSGPKTRSRYE